MGNEDRDGRYVNISLLHELLGHLDFETDEGAEKENTSSSEQRPVIKGAVKED